MTLREFALSRHPDQVARLVRILGASINVNILNVLMAERKNPKSEGWMFLSEIAERLDEKPGTVGMAVQKLMPLLEERREKGKRYFRSRIKELTLRVDRIPEEEDLLA
ncbi:MAG TPA: hypothetical protein VNZ52_01000 [Candidatus Thermoplasmatota archaeon]|nr:hypothetical protein [Candidatus Thermoplasmatota archaeon]